MVSFVTSGLRKIGLGLTGFGVIFTLIGVLLFFDLGFLRMGNILFVSGVIMIVGLKSALQFFTKSQNCKGSLSLGVGFFLVIKGWWPIVGLIMETYGFVVFFCEFWPTVAIFWREVPILGRMICPSYAPPTKRFRRVPV